MSIFKAIFLQKGKPIISSGLQFLLTKDIYNRGVIYKRKKKSISDYSLLCDVLGNSTSKHFQWNFLKMCVNISYTYVLMSNPNIWNFISNLGPKVGGK